MKTAARMWSKMYSFNKSKKKPFLASVAYTVISLTTPVNHTPNALTLHVPASGF